MPNSILKHSMNYFETSKTNCQLVPGHRKNQTEMDPGFENQVMVVVRVRRCLRIMKWANILQMRSNTIRHFSNKLTNKSKSGAFVIIIMTILFCVKAFIMSNGCFKHTCISRNIESKDTLSQRRAELQDDCRTCQ